MQLLLKLIKTFILVAVLLKDTIEATKNSVTMSSKLKSGLEGSYTQACFQYASEPVNTKAKDTKKSQTF